MYKIVSLIYKIVSNMKALVDLLNIILTRTLLIALNWACVEIRWERNEKAVNTQKRISSLEVFRVILYRQLSILYHLMIFFWIEWVCVHNYTKIKGLDTQKLHCQRANRDKHGASPQSLPKMNRMLFTRLICIQWKFITPDHLTIAH